MNNAFPRRARTPRSSRFALVLVALLATVLTGCQAMAQGASEVAISLGQTLRGQLSSSDTRLDSGEYFDSYRFNGVAGQRITITMRSSQLDAYVGIVGPNGFSDENDDAASGSTDAELTLTLPTTGSYTIVATSYAPGETGNYTLRLIDLPVAQQPGALQAGQTVLGSLASGDDRLVSGEYVDAWTYTGRRGERLIITLESRDFDTYLMVRGDLEDENDDDPAVRGSTDSRLDVTLPADGTYRILATSYAPGETGEYALRVIVAGGDSSLPSDAVESIAVGQSVNGRLSPSDPQLDSGEFFDGYALSGRRGQQLEIRLDSEHFDPYLSILGPNGFGEYNDDDPESNTLNSRLRVTLPEDGTYHVYATSYAGEETGDYVLRVIDAGEAQPQGGSGVQLQLGSSVSGELGPGDETLTSGEFVDRYTFSGQVGQRVTISMSSSELDAYLLLRSPSGANEYNDDVGAGNTNSRLETILAESGVYTIGATSYAPGETGGYTLQIAPGTGGGLGAARGQEGRVFAVMVGISDYQGFAGDLPYTDEDAIKLYQALSDAGVLAEQSVLLVDGQATRANIIAAFQQVAAAAGPDDTFLFFFSGHGNQRPVAVAGNEPDDRDETIVAVDGEITDDEMAALFRLVRADTAIIALDACFSGGFARDVVAVPGVMGVFSSEEDLTSAVASKFQAGGYLSLFLRTGLVGGADENRDGVVTAGELSVYLRLQFNEHVHGVGAQTLEGQRNYQFLVVDRGGVRVDDALLALR